MDQPKQPEALYYPYHVCSEKTLLRLLAQFARVHFRNPMALQLTPLSPQPSTVETKRIGDLFPDLLKEGRIVQGYSVGRPLDDIMRRQVNADLKDPVWRRIFHQGLVLDREFQRGLENQPIHAALLSNTWEVHPFDLDQITGLLQSQTHGPENPALTYGLRLVHASAALWHTARLSHQYHLQAVTDSRVYHDLFDRSLARERQADG